MICVFNTISTQSQHKENTSQLLISFNLRLLRMFCFVFERILPKGEHTMDVSK